MADGKTGFLVPPNEPEILAQKIIDFLNDKELQKNMSINSIKRVNHLFTWNRVANMVSDLYEKIMVSKNVVIKNNAA